MAYFNVPENPEFTKEIRKFETTDPAHADLFNNVVQALINNEVFIKKMAEQLYATAVASSESYTNEVYQQATGYVDQKISDLINGAPSTLDTLGEIASAMEDNKDVVEALDTAIGSKVSETEFDSYKKETEKLLGNINISSIGDGTLTGAINELKTAFARIGSFRNYTVYYDRQDYSLSTLLNTLHYELQKLTSNTAFTATLQSGSAYGVFGFYSPDVGGGEYGAMHIIQYNNSTIKQWYASLHANTIKLSDVINIQTPNSTI